MKNNMRLANGIAGLSLGFIISILLTPMLIAFYYTEMFTKNHPNLTQHCDSWSIVTIPVISAIGFLIGLCKKT